MHDTDTQSDAGRPTPSMDRDTTYSTDAQAAVLLQSPRGGRLLLYIIVLFVAAAFVWAWLAQIDDVIKGQGKVIPLSKNQLIQNLEGGILKEVLVREGQVVEKGTPLLLLKDLQFSADFQKNRFEAISLQAAIERLEAEARGNELVFSEKLESQYPEVVAEQRDLAQSRRENLQNQIDVLELSKKEKQATVAQLKQKMRNAQVKYNLAVTELRKYEPLQKSGVVSELDVLREREKVIEAKTIMDDARLAIPEVEAMVLEIQERIDRAVTDFKEQARQEKSDLTRKSQGLIAFQASLKDKVDRTVIKSPVRGTVKKTYVDTIGGTVRPGMTVMEIVPIDDTLLIETKIAPKDIGFIRLGQKAKIKLSAYDFAVYGGLVGEVQQVSADSMTDEQGRTYFIIKVSTPQHYIGNQDDNLLIIPGMQAEVDIVVTRRNILDYVLRPLLKSKFN
ncbi:HlyD family type I secretion periplasmic adaptor subunit [Pseudodesulfovibrio sp. JC047]|uniref:HlyD family type I secretion periplasmic adaptor subunit n=1 Tax=Pseudodesulfovibrio sp. JC047 TaxID=2683199 RepID=UPI0013D62180|nr:HlyD family type I secretion periplasmic adaptor subunit [Pseudodesulfovibrio sp. JC047]NDV19282.1 HlyD family type I secretion periplasmic adaptor subunit [Pseudodesulfovibrio sp. JC047]